MAFYMTRYASAYHALYEETLAKHERACTLIIDMMRHDDKWPKG